MIDSVSNEGANRADLKRGRRDAGRTLNVDRLPPHDAAAELGVLSCISQAPNECLGECVAKFKGNREVFYDLRHQLIFGAWVEMWDQQRPIDTIATQAWLKDRGLLEQIGGLPYLSALPDAAPSAANLSYYLDIVFEKYLLRRAITACTAADFGKPKEKQTEF